MNVIVKKMSFIVLFGMQCSAAQGEKEPWTWLFQKKLTDQEIVENKHKKELAFSRTSNPFSQLVFSWNAERPQQGHFSFWVQVRDHASQKWGVWHKMMAWGNGIQKSFITEGDAYTKYIHVRLETKPNTLADAFRIKIMTHDLADMALLKAFAVSISDLTKFNPEEHKVYERLPSVHVGTVPQYSQFMLDHPRNNSLCSPTSCSMLTGYLAQKEVDPVEFAEKAYDSGLGIYGSWPFNIAHAYEHCAGSSWFAVARFDSFKWLHAWLQRGIPVVVSVRGPLLGAASGYSQGHLLVVVGFDHAKQHVMCHDPAFPSRDRVVTSYPLKNFLEAWERSRRLVYLADPQSRAT